MNPPFDRAESAIERLRRADEKLTGAIRWVEYESVRREMQMSGDHANWNNEPAARSMHAAPPEVSTQYAKEDARARFWKRIVLFTVILAVGAFAVWVSLNWPF